MFAATYGIAIFAQTFTDFGLTQYIVQLRVANRHDEKIGAALRLGRTISIVVASVGMLGFALLASTDSHYWSLLLMPVWVAADKQVEARLSVSLADGRLWQNATSLVMRRSGALVVLALTQVFHIDPVWGYLAGLASCSLLAWLALSIFDSDVRTDRTVRKRLLFGGGYHYWTNSLSLQAMNLDTTLVALVTAPPVAGYYGAASRLTTPLRIVPTTFATLLFPAAARTKSGDHKPLFKAIAWLTALTTVMYSALAVLLPLLVPALLGPEYGPATDVIQIVCIGLIFAALSSQLRSLMQGWGYLRTVTLISAVSTALSLTAILITAHYSGAFGAGIALAGSFAFQLLIQSIAIAAISRSRNR